MVALSTLRASEVRSNTLASWSAPASTEPRSSRYSKLTTPSVVRYRLIIHNQMVSTLPSSYENFPATYTEMSATYTAMSALKKLLDGDLELRSSILRRQDAVQLQYTYAKKAAEVFADCLATTRAVKDAYAASILSTKALEKALKNCLNLYDNHRDLLETTSSTKAMLATWVKIVALTEALLTRLDKATPQVEAHLHLAADEHAAHESAHIAASESKRSCTKMLHEVDRSIAKHRAALSGVRRIPTEILAQIFIEAVDARQHEIITSLSSYYDTAPSYHDLDALSKTLNLVPFTLSATCKRWRAICQSTPQLWMYARVPMIYSTDVGYKIIGKPQFDQCVLLAQKQSLDLTVFPCYNPTQDIATYPNLELPTKSQTLRVNIVWHNDLAIPPEIPSPTELFIVASTNSRIRSTQVLPTQLLANTKTLRCAGLTPRIDSTVGIQILHISHSTHGALLPSSALRALLQNCPQLEELHLENLVYPLMNRHICSFTHQQLHTISFTGNVLPWVMKAFTGRFPHLSRLILTDIDGLDSDGYSWSPPHSISDQLSLLTHIEVHTTSEPSVVASLRPLFEASTALRTLTLVGSAVEPMLSLLTLPVPKKVQELRLSHSDANGTTLRDYLTAIERDGGGTPGMQVVWNNCPNISGEYGKAFGGLHL